MGKLKRKKQRLHLPAVKSDESKNVSSLNQSSSEFQKPVPVNPAVTKSNLFAGLKVDPKLLTQKLPQDFDARSSITSKTFKGLNLKKKEKRKLKHETWMQKIDSIQAAKKEEKERKRRQKTVIVGDMSVLQDALPTLEHLLKGTDSKTDKKTQKSRGIAKEKTRQKQMMSDIELFKQVLDHPAYKTNPTSAITEHLKNKLKQDEEMDT